MFKRIGINFLIIMIFVPAMGAVTLPFLAGVQINAADRLESKQRWVEAEQAYQRALALAPLSAEYFNAYGDFLWEAALATGSDQAWAGIAPAYRRAVELNSRCAECLVDLGQIRLANGADAEAVADFRKARALDPRGRDTAFMLKDAAGRLLEKDVRCLDAAVGFAGDYAVSRDGLRMIAAAFKAQVLGETGPELVQAIKDALSGDGEVTAVVGPDQWLGVSLDGLTEYTGGSLLQAGTVDGLVRVTQKKSTVTVRARGTPANGVYPFMLVELDGQSAGQCFVDSGEWRDYDFPVSAKEGVNVLSVTFANGPGVMPAADSRRLFVGPAEVRNKP